MIKLLAKNQSSGRYYFSNGDGCVYYIKPPLERAEKEYVDTVPVFLRKSFDTDLTFDEQEFSGIEELRTFAMHDCTPAKHGISLNSEKQDLLTYATVEIVEEYFAMIEDMITRKEFVGLDMFFKQLSRNFELMRNPQLMDRKNRLRSSFDNARFSHIDSSINVFEIEKRIREKCSVLYVA